MKNLNVLVAEDEAIVRTFIRTVIDREKLPVSLLLEADNGDDAIKIAQEQAVDLIFMDILMPGTDGIRAAEKIINAMPDVNIVIISAHSDFGYARDAFRAGVLDYLLKPLRPEDIVKTIMKKAEQVENQKDASASLASREGLFDMVDQYVKSNLAKEIHLKDIAQAVFLSPCHLSRKFKQVTGKSVIEFVQEIRLSKAEELLKDSELTITEIAYQAGFTDSAYFTNCFKKRTGKTPTQYRKMQ